MGTLTGLRTAIRDHTGESTTTLPNALIDEFVNTAQERMLQSHDWRGQQATDTLSYTSTTDGLALPAGGVRDLIVSQADAAQSDPSRALTPLGRTTRENWLGRVNAADESRGYARPSLEGPYYYVWADKVYVVPNPTATLSLRLDYVGGLTELSEANLTNFFTERYFRALKWGGLTEAYAYLHEWEAAGNAETFFGKMLLTAIKHDQGLGLAGGAAPRHRGT